MSDRGTICSANCFFTKLKQCSWFWEQHFEQASSCHFLTRQSGGSTDCKQQSQSGHWHFVSNCQQNSWGRSPICRVLLTIEVASWAEKRVLPFRELILCLLSLCWGQNCSATAFSVSLEMRSLKFRLYSNTLLMSLQVKVVRQTVVTGHMINSFNSWSKNISLSQLLHFWTFFLIFSDFMPTGWKVGQRIQRSS